MGEPPVQRGRGHRARGKARMALVALLSLFVLSTLSGCALVRLRDDVRFSQDSCLLFGEVISPSAAQKPIVVAAYQRSGNAVAIADYAVLSEAGPYELLVPHGQYELAAFADLAGGGQGYYGKPDRVSTGSHGMILGLDIRLSREATEADLSLRERLRAALAGMKKPATSAGAIAALDDPVYSAEQGLAGFWAPLDYFRKIGANIVFLEPYDPKKIPILFVHGAAGSPQDWRYCIDRLDRTRYQPWIFYYPSGSRLDTASFLLQKKLYDLKSRYRFEHLFVVAHSMGGLVSRSALMEKSIFQENVRLFISISTPWGGEGRAKTGVELSPAVIPSWKDVDPDSAFLKQIFARPLPPSIRYYLFFGHKGGGSLFRQNNDNTVTLESMLDMRAQADALRVTGLNEDHVSILSSPELVAQFKTILAATEANIEKTYVRTKGYLQVQHTFAPADTKIPLQMALVLAPAGTNEPETQFKMDPFAPLQEIGGVAPGKYDASLCALGFKTEPDHLPVEIQAGRIAETRFVLKPQGMIAGWITADTAGEDRFWGFYRDLPAQVKIRTITLTGNGLMRRLTPVDTLHDREVLATFLASKDYAFKSQFAFFGVPAGEYDLTIVADGCQAFAAKVKSTPGDFLPPSPFKLILK